MTEADALAYWLGNDRETFVAEDDREIIGAYTFVPISPVAASTFATAPMWNFRDG
jgi:hypothetical protein